MEEDSTNRLLCRSRLDLPAVPSIVAEPGTNLVRKKMRLLAQIKPRVGISGDVQANNLGLVADQQRQRHGLAGNHGPTVGRGTALVTEANGMGAVGIWR